jgi:integrase
MVSLELRDIKTIRSGADAHIVFNLNPDKTKGNKARIVPILSDGVIFLKSYLKGWRPSRPGPWLFPSPYEARNAVSVRALSLYVKKIAEKIKAPSLSPHAFRRVYITTLHRQGVDMVTIGRLVGHSSIQTTRDHYLAIEPEELAGKVAGVRLVPKGDHADKVEAAKRRALSLMEETKEDRLDIPDIPPNLFDILDDDDDDDADDDAA